MNDETKAKQAVPLFERIKACKTPEEITALLSGGGRYFCPRGYQCPGDPAESPLDCRPCITAWLKGVGCDDT